ncbi:helix-turn-helix domain-containing protein [Robbsia andropogonis]|uniref:helix-turn-helix domain-containing protein n=1 Tax=Robbsia andropogonis TaxID=28092 RepID=UPI002A6A5E4C|nr:XRE family transcriptional regulator [Robbsia andropogonis]
MDVNLVIGRRLRGLRDERGWSLDVLADRSKVSRSNISLIERGQSSPTAVVLDKLATALSVPLASLFEPSAVPTAAPSPVSRAAEQSVWTDPASGYIRRRLSPLCPSPIQLVEVNFPAGRCVSYDSGPREVDIQQQVWILEGEMHITVGETVWRLEPGDCLAVRLDCPTVFKNSARKAARYLVALTTLYPNERRNG